MRIYTKTGDDGQTGLLAGPRVAKDDVRIEAYGTVDELNAALGTVRSYNPPAEMDELLVRIQNHLFAVGAELATPEPQAYGTALISTDDTAALEAAIDRYEDELPVLKQFILPAGTRLSTSLHMARAICRRAERRVVTLYRGTGAGVRNQPLCYLNRLGDLLFVLARAANAAGGVSDVPWQKPPA